MNTFLSIIIMVIMGLLGFFAGLAFNNNAFEGAILFVLISGIACIIKAMEQNNEKR